MAEPVDVAIDAALGAVESSGLGGADWRMAVVDALPGDGTCTVSTSTGAFPGVRMVATGVQVGFRVLISRDSLGNWICLGKRMVGSDFTEWTDAALATGFTGGGNSNGTVQYRIIPVSTTRMVQWRGGLNVTYPNAAPNSIANGGDFLAATLPTDFRPPVRRSLPVACSAASNDLVPTIKVDFNTDGTTQVVGTRRTTATNSYTNPTIEPSWVSLNGIAYTV